MDAAYCFYTVVIISSGGKFYKNANLIELLTFSDKTIKYNTK